MRAEFIVRRSAGALVKTLQWLHAAREGWGRRRLVYHLASLDDYLLRDMGITRQDVASVLADPGLDDPTVALAARARDSRRGKRASALEEQRWMAMLDETVPADARPAETRCRAA